MTALFANEARAIENLKKIVKRWDDEPFAAMGYDANHDRKIIKECLRLVSGIAGRLEEGILDIGDR